MENSKIYFLGLAGGYLVYLGIQQYVLLFRRKPPSPGSMPWQDFCSSPWAVWCW